MTMEQGQGQGQGQGQEYFSEGLKHKHEATQRVKEYLMYLIIQSMTSEAICFDKGGEFLNNELVNWVKERGITVKTTAPYSPSQNRVAERQN